MRWLLGFLLFMCVGYSISALAAESGVAVRSCKVLNEPFADAREIASLKAGDSVDIGRRKGGWLQVTAKGKTGWVRMLFVRRGASAGKTSAVTEASGVLGLATGRSGKGNVVAATGVRGLSEEELKGATYNAQEFSKLKTYATSVQESQSFAKEGGLQSLRVELLENSAGK
ncbi:SH3 domain-containing protein [Candidatus Nitronereus thalassa]|uniref:SH3 domain-containing protein n=1 Tax=Candidatus Nitronereus thalassa TaxID=3020898 RepID=A0ABU3KCI7_9BACT|nr:SH3 domain-containing protein [Candidatus Nitronereus thalassa]MDT7043982.1 SH3 domain-containing protein [Candidatus Nitronereus thalassa]